MDTASADVRVRLHRLAKGALFVGIAVGYVLLVGLTLVLFGWRAALLAGFFVLTGLCFRHIADEADRIGLGLAGDSAGAPAGAPDDAADARHYQHRMLRIFAALTQVPNVALAVQAFLLGGWTWGAAATAALVIVELLYVPVRDLNRRTAFREASYGFRDRAPLRGGGVNAEAARDLRTAEVERGLTELCAMVRDGRVSQRAYEKACDRYRVRAVMAPGGG